VSPLARVAALIFAPALFGMGCELLHGAARPTSYAGELAACEAQAPEGPAGWVVYTPCCEDVARRYSRDPSFCQPPARDAGDQ
jgi:hypothetical protein